MPPDRSACDEDSSPRLTFTSIARWCQAREFKTGHERDIVPMRPRWRWWRAGRGGHRHHLLLSATGRPLSLG
jgi:hypothetical protein